jgi:hypothetical protein
VREVCHKKFPGCVDPAVEIMYDGEDYEFVG